MSGESKMFETDTSLMNYRHDRCMSAESNVRNRDRFNELLT